MHLEQTWLILFIHALNGCDTASIPYVRYRKNIRENILSRVTRHMQKLMMHITKHLYAIIYGCEPITDLEERAARF